MKKKSLLILGGVLCLLLLLCACGKETETSDGRTKKQYIVGKNPKLEEITGFEISYGTSRRDESWSYRLSRSSKNVYSLSYTRWEEAWDGMFGEEMEISEAEWESLLSLLEGEKLVKDKKDDGVMDGDSQTVRLLWDKAPSDYHLELDVNLLRTIMQKLRTLYYNYRSARDLSGCEIQSFDFYTTGSYVNAGVEYEVRDELDREGKPTGRKLIVYKEDGVAREDAKTAPCDEAFLETLRALLEAYQVAAWDGFSVSDPNVLDGTSFGLSVIFREQEKSISAHGYMSFPPHYRDVRDALEGLFREAVN